ncbi:telomeric repeat-binding factor 2-interacting protein 1 [Ahaetulla prasina]|uniref:telomeric repeat-binding factor 2-interacting protein 1 n=1 Tax=Ahaetulla prasina TaxID=499056 RepID=UPI00264A312A|nr:telomeric repeat-binding factor 2-interacting protein 1 [Ahaetulla prasina]
MAAVIKEAILLYKVCQGEIHVKFMRVGILESTLQVLNGLTTDLRPEQRRTRFQPLETSHWAGATREPGRPRWMEAPLPRCRRPQAPRSLTLGSRSSSSSAPAASARRDESFSHCSCCFASFSAAFFSAFSHPPQLSAATAQEPPSRSRAAPRKQPPQGQHGEPAELHSLLAKARLSLAWLREARRRRHVCRPEAHDGLPPSEERADRRSRGGRGRAFTRSAQTSGATPPAGRRRTPRARQTPGRSCAGARQGSARSGSSLRLEGPACGRAPMEVSRLPALFRQANREFEQEDGEGSGWAEPAAPASPGLGTSRGRRPPPDVQVTVEINAAGAVADSRRSPEPEGPPAAPVAQAVEDMERLMGEFGVDLATVTQAFLKNSGEVAAVASCLRTGRRSDGRPLWNRQDDEDLLQGRAGAKNNLETKYGVGNVNKRVLFRRSLCQE